MASNSHITIFHSIFDCRMDFLHRSVYNKLNKKWIHDGLMAEQSTQLMMAPPMPPTLPICIMKCALMNPDHSRDQNIFISQILSQMVDIIRLNDVHFNVWQNTSEDSKNDEHNQIDFTERRTIKCVVGKNRPSKFPFILCERRTCYCNKVGHRTQVLHSVRHELLQYFST